MKRFFFVYALWFSACTAAQVSVPSPPAPSPPADEKFAIDATSPLVIGVSQQIQLSVQGTLAEKVSVQWASDHPLIATITSSGKVTGIQSGTAKISASSSGKTAMLTIIVNAHAAPLVIEGNRWRSLGISAIQQLTLGGSRKNEPVTWFSQAPEIASVNEAGQITGLSAGTTAITVYLTDNYWINDTISATVSLDATSGNVVKPAPGLPDGFLTDENEKLAWAYTDGGIDIYSNPNGTWMLTSYNNTTRTTKGWYYDLNGRGVTRSGNTNSPTHNAYSMANGVQYDDRNGLELQLTPYLIKVNNIPYILLMHILTNTSDVPLTGQKFGACSDVMIGSNDTAPVLRNTYGNIEMSGSTNNKNYKLIFVCKSGEPVTPVTTSWYGRCNSGTATPHFWQHIYDDGIGASYAPGNDSAFAFSYQNIDLAPHASKTFVVRLTLIEN